MAESKKRTGRRWIILKSLLLVLVVFMGMGAPVYFLTESMAIGIISSLPMTGIVLILIIRFWWLPNNIYGKILGEGLAAFATWGGQLSKMWLQYSDHVQDEKGVITAGKAPERILGGIRLLWRWPFEDVMTVLLPKRIEVDSRDNFIDKDAERTSAVDVRARAYGIILEDLETKVPEKMNIAVRLLAVIRIYNPVLAFVTGPHTWMEMFFPRMEVYVAPCVKEKTYDEWTTAGTDALAQMIKEKMENDSNGNFFRLCKDTYGIEILSLEVKGIDPPETIRAKTMEAAVAKQELLAAEEKAKITLVNAGAQAQATEITLKPYEKSPVGPLWILSSALEKSQAGAVPLMMTLQSARDTANNAIQGKNKKRKKGKRKE